jgi:deoxyribose-phosphate aldolase
MSAEQTWTKVDRLTAARNLGLAGMARLLDATLLKPEATAGQATAMVDDALARGANICVNECRLALALQRRTAAQREHCAVAAVIAFPFGACTTEIKVAAARAVLALGADEIDMVANIGLLKEGAREDWEADVEEVARAVADYNRREQVSRVLKVIIETCHLSDAEKEFTAGTIAGIARRWSLPMFVKTSTGYGLPPAGVPVGATLGDVKLLRTAAGVYDPAFNPVGVKASGGVRDAAAALDFAFACGAFDGHLQPLPDAPLAARIGTSSASTILAGFSGLLD